MKVSSGKISSRTKLVSNGLKSAKQRRITREVKYVKHDVVKYFRIRLDGDCVSDSHQYLSKHVQLLNSGKLAGKDLRAPNSSRKFQANRRRHSTFNIDMADLLDQIKEV
jgi:hypothetical protein